MGYLKWKCPWPAPDCDLFGFRFLFRSLSLSFFFSFALFYLARLRLGNVRTLRLSFLIAVIGKQRGTYLAITRFARERSQRNRYATPRNWLVNALKTPCVVSKLSVASCLSASSFQPSVRLSNRYFDPSTLSRFRDNGNRCGNGREIIKAYMRHGAGNIARLSPEKSPSNRMARVLSRRVNARRYRHRIDPARSRSGSRSCKASPLGISKLCRDVPSMHARVMTISQRRVTPIPNI
jgi:hypothetical protein